MNQRPKASCRAGRHGDRRQRGKA